MIDSGNKNQGKQVHDMPAIVLRESDIRKFVGGQLVISINRVNSSCGEIKTIHKEGDGDYQRLVLHFNWFAEKKQSDQDVVWALNNDLVRQISLYTRTSFEVGGGKISLKGGDVLYSLLPPGTFLLDPKKIRQLISSES